jgi:hypothetical protein
MVDVFLQEFYDSVKDATWPDISSYNDFISLPKEIMDECETVHSFKQRMNEIYNDDYWRRLTTPIFVFENLVYIPIAKCAHSYYSNYFGNVLGWRSTTLQNINPNDMVMFGLMMNPITHFLKGVTQCLWQVPEIRNCDEDRLSGFIHQYYKYLIGQMLVGDTHTVPYSVKFGNMLTQTNWIPMDQYSDNQIKVAFVNLFKKVGHDISMDFTDARLNSSSPKKIQLFQIVKEIFLLEEYRERLYRLYILRSTDINFYNQLLDTHTLSWEHKHF